LLGLEDEDVVGFENVGEHKECGDTIGYLYRLFKLIPF
jgi:hypothetical protein